MTHGYCYLLMTLSNDQDTIGFQADVDLVANLAKFNHLQLNSRKSITHSHVSQCLQSYCMVLDWIRFTTSNLSVYGCQITFFGRSISSMLLIKHVATYSELFHLFVPPLLDYACVLWDPLLSKHKQQLEKVQLFATRMASKQWNESAETLNGHFNLPPLTTRQIYYFKLLYLYKLVNGHVFCPAGLLAYNPTPM